VILFLENVAGSAGGAAEGGPAGQADAKPQMETADETKPSSDNRQPDETMKRQDGKTCICI